MKPCMLLVVTLFVSASVQFTYAVRPQIQLDVLMRALENMYVQEGETEPAREAGNQEANAEEETEQEQPERSRVSYMNNLMQWLEFEMFLQKIPKTTVVFAAMCEELLGWLENGYLRQWLVNLNKRDGRVSNFMSILAERQSNRGEPREREDMDYWQALISSCSAYHRDGNGNAEEEPEQEENESTQN